MMTEYQARVRIDGFGGVLTATIHAANQSEAEQIVEGMVEIRGYEISVFKAGWACPIGHDGCVRHCGSYGCGG